MSRSTWTDATGGQCVRDQLSACCSGFYAVSFDLSEVTCEACQRQQAVLNHASRGEEKSAERRRRRWAW